MQKNQYQTTAVFLQDHVTFAERYHLLAATRWNQLEIKNNDAAAFLKRDTTYSQFTSRLGVAVDLTKSITLFSGWGQGMIAPVGSVIAGEIKPITSQQWETGFKAQLGNKLQASVAVFQNTRSNEPVAVGLTSVQEGKTRASGIDSNIIWQPTPEFSALLNYTFQDARVKRGGDTLKEGSQIPRVPEHSARAAVRYDFKSGSLKGLGAGAGVTMASRREGNPSNTFSTNGFAVADAQISYTRGAATFSVGIENLFDSHFYQPYAFLGGAVAPNQPRTAFAQATYRF